MAALTVADPVPVDTLLKLKEQAFFFLFFFFALRKGAHVAKAEGIVGMCVV